MKRYNEEMGIPNSNLKDSNEYEKIDINILFYKN